MSILNIARVETGAVNVSPGTIKCLSTDTLAKVTTAGYLTSSLVAGGIGPKDKIEMIYSYNQRTATGTFGIFNVSLSSNGVVTLSLWGNPGDVLLPVVSGHAAVFNGTTGQIKDSGAAMSNASNAFLATSAGSLTSGNLPVLTDVNGSIGDSGVNLMSLDAPISRAAFLGMFSSPIQLIPAAGANTIIVLHRAFIIFTYGSSQLANGGAVSFTYGSGGSVLACASQQASDFTGATASTIYQFVGNSGNSSQVLASASVNTAIYLSNATGFFTSGNGSSFIVRAYYSVIPTNS